MSMRSNLSFDKMAMFLAEHDIRIEKSFILDGEAVFIEAVTSKREEQFIIMIPEKYRMPVKISHRHINIEHTKLQSQADSFLDELSSEFNLDICLISSNIITYNGESYKLYSEKRVADEPSILQQLESQAKAVIYNTNARSENMIEVDGDEPSINNLDFIDFDGTSVPRSSPYEQMIAGFDKYKDEQLQSNEQALAEENWSLSNMNLKIGQLFPLVSIRDFSYDATKIDEIGDQIHEWYRTSYEKEKEFRRIRFRKLAEKQKQIMSHYDSICREYEKKEVKLLDSIRRLDGIVDTLTFQNYNNEATIILKNAQQERGKVQRKFIQIREDYNDYIETTMTQLDKILQRQLDIE